MGLDNILDKGIGFYITLFIGLTLLPTFLDLGEDAVVAFNTTLVGINANYLTVGNTLITVVRLAPYAVIVAIVGAVVLWIKSSMGKKGF